MSSVSEMRDRLRASLDQVVSKLEGVEESQMELPIPRRQQPATVRYMFYRFIAHEVEHTVQLAKSLTSIGAVQGEAQLILRNLQASQGELEGMLVGLSDQDLDRPPAEGEWSPRQVLEHIIEVHGSYTQRIQDAL